MLSRRWLAGAPRAFVSGFDVGWSPIIPDPISVDRPVHAYRGSPTRESCGWSVRIVGFCVEDTSRCILLRPATRAIPPISLTEQPQQEQAQDSPIHFRRRPEGGVACVLGGCYESSVMVSRRLNPKWLRSSAWACVALIAYLSLIPKEIEVRTGLPGQLEHAFAYGCTGALLWLAYPDRPWRVVLGLFAYGCALEFLQRFVPGRTSQIIDAAASSFGALLGVLAPWSVQRRRDG